jgi:hypothetical protein
VLLCNKIPFKVFFGQKPRWIRAKTLEPLKDKDNGIGVKGDSDSELNRNKDLVLTKIKA